MPQREEGKWMKNPIFVNKYDFFAQISQFCVFFLFKPFICQFVSLFLPLGFNWNKSNNTKIY